MALYSKLCLDSDSLAYKVAFSQRHAVAGCSDSSWDLMPSQRYDCGFPSLVHPLTSLNWEILVIKKISWLPQTTKNLHAKFTNNSITMRQRIVNSCSTFSHNCLFRVTVMACLRYLMVFLTREVCSIFISTVTAIAEANCEVQEATSGSSKKRGPSPVAASEVNVVPTNAASSFVHVCTYSAISASPSL